MSWGVRHLTVTFGGQTALDDVCLDVPRSEVTAVVGGDGAGKTTLLRTLVGLVPATRGEVRRPVKHAVGYLPSSSGTYPDLSVDENLALTATAYGLAPAEWRPRAAELLDRMGLTPFGARLAGQLSGGMRQKLGVVRALLNRPELVVLDEPTTGVDPVSRADLWWLVAQAAGSGAAVVLATTYLDEAERTHRVLVLDDGRPLARGTPDEIVASVEGTPSLRRAVVELALRQTRSVHATDPPEGTSHAQNETGGGMGRPTDRSDGTTSELMAHTRQVSRRFGDFVAVDRVDLDVRSGEVVGLLGANGAGKTTLIRLLLGLLRPTGGEVALFGEPPSRSTRRRLGYVPQGLGLYDDLSATENLAFGRAVFGAGAELPADLEAVGDRLIGDLSLGLKRRIAFVDALGHRPELLVLDEPTSGVDPLARARLWETIREVADDGAGILVTTHNMDEAEECDRLVVMAAGRVVAQGTVAEIVGDATVVAVDSDDWARCFAAVESAGLSPVLVGRTVRVPGASVDQVATAVGELPARFDEVPITLEERFVELASVSSATDGSEAAA